MDKLTFQTEAAKKKADKKNPLANMPDGAPGGLLGGGKAAFDNKPKSASKADANKKTQKTSGAKKSK
jgi:hypothetical protein